MTTEPELGARDSSRGHGHQGSRVPTPSSPGWPWIIHTPPQWHDSPGLKFRNAGPHQDEAGDTDPRVQSPTEFSLTSVEAPGAAQSPGAVRQTHSMYISASQTSLGVWELEHACQAAGSPGISGSADPRETPRFCFSKMFQAVPWPLPLGPRFENHCRVLQRGARAKAHGWLGTILGTIPTGPALLPHRQRTDSIVSPPAPVADGIVPSFLIPDTVAQMSAKTRSPSLLSTIAVPMQTFCCIVAENLGFWQGDS